MNCSKKASFIINGNNLLYCNENHINITLKRQNFQIINGTVYNQKQEPCIGAAVQVVQISCYDHTRKLLGYTLTDESGHYLFSIDAKPCMKYELTIYAPLH